MPNAFRMDNGPEFIALALRGLCHRRGINAAYIDPGKPWQNGYAESFHSRLRDEYLDGEVFWGVRDARVGLNSYRSYFNTERLHSSLGYQTPFEFVASWSHSQWEQSEDATTTRVASVVCTKEESNYKSVEWLTCTPFRSSGRVTLFPIFRVLVGSAATQRETSLPKNYAA